MHTGHSHGVDMVANTELIGAIDRLTFLQPANPLAEHYAQTLLIQHKGLLHYCNSAFLSQFCFRLIENTNDVLKQR